MSLSIGQWGCDLIYYGHHCSKNFNLFQIKELVDIEEVIGRRFVYQVSYHFLRDDDNEYNIRIFKPLLLINGY